MPSSRPSFSLIASALRYIALAPSKSPRVVEDAEVAVRAGHAVEPAELLLDRQRLVVHGLGPVQVAAGLDDAEVAVLAGHTFEPAELLVDRQRLAIHGLGPVQSPRAR